jgi:hypothetical protein
VGPRRAFFNLIVCSLTVVAALACPAGALEPDDPETDITCATGQHRLAVVNKCDHSVWLGEIGNSLGACISTSDCGSGLFCNAPPQCTGDADCESYTCTTAADCPGPNAGCVNGQCTGNCDQTTGNCYCSTSKGAAACPAGGTCTKPASSSSDECEGGLCTYSTVVPARWHLNPKGQAGHAVGMCIPQGWQGRFWGRTGCTGTGNQLNCLTGQCGNPGQLQCAQSGANGVTLFEPTFDAGGVDYYDVSIGSGYNVPLEVDPSDSSCVKTGGCTQDLNTTCPSALQVTGGACSTDADCSASGLCGNQGLCIIGCLDPCDACGLASPPASLHCETFKDLYCCLGNQAGNSCNSASTTCFDDNDCANLANGQFNGTCDLTTHLCNVPCSSDADCGTETCDTTIGQCKPPVYSCSSVSDCPAVKAPQPAPSCSSVEGFSESVCVPQTDCCGPYNKRWLRATKKAGGGTLWTSTFKAACPTAYSYQFDDPTSTFTCPETGTAVNYRVFFCPGTTGAPHLRDIDAHSGDKRVPHRASGTGRS